MQAGYNGWIDSRLEIERDGYGLRWGKGGRCERWSGPSGNAVKNFSERFSRLSVAEVAQAFGHPVQTAESLGDFRYEMLNGVHLRVLRTFTPAPFIPTTGFDSTTLPWSLRSPRLLLLVLLLLLIKLLLILLLRIILLRVLLL